MDGSQGGFLSVHDALRANGFAHEFAQVLDSINKAKGQSRLTAALHKAVALLGFDGGAFLSFVREDESRESFRFTVACSPKWCALYSANGWFQLDPGLIHAQSSSTPVLLESLPIRTQSQRDIMASARIAGFVSGVVVPVHTSGGRSRMGVLYLASGKPGYIDDAGLQAVKMYVRGLSTELLEWWCATICARLQADIQLNESDLQIMRLCHQGLRSKEIASMIGSTTNGVDQRVAKIIARLGAESRRDAASKLASHGLIN